MTVDVPAPDEARPPSWIVQTRPKSVGWEKGEVKPDMMMREIPPWTSKTLRRLSQEVVSFIDDSSSSSSSAAGSLKPSRASEPSKKGTPSADTGIEEGVPHRLFIRDEAARRGQRGSTMQVALQEENARFALSPPALCNISSDYEAKVEMVRLRKPRPPPHQQSHTNAGMDLHSPPPPPPQFFNAAGRARRRFVGLSEAIDAKRSEFFKSAFGTPAHFPTSFPSSIPIHRRCSYINSAIEWDSPLQTQPPLVGIDSKPGAVCFTPDANYTKRTTSNTQRPASLVIPSQHTGGLTGQAAQQRPTRSGAVNYENSDHAQRRERFWKRRPLSWMPKEPTPKCSGTPNSTPSRLQTIGEDAISHPPPGHLKFTAPRRSHSLLGVTRASSLLSLLLGRNGRVRSSEHPRSKASLKAVSKDEEGVNVRCRDLQDWVSVMAGHWSMK